MSQPSPAGLSSLHPLQANGQLVGAAVKQLTQQHKFLGGEFLGELPFFHLDGGLIGLGQHGVTRMANGRSKSA